MGIYRSKYLVFVLTNYIITLIVFLKYKGLTHLPPPFAHHLVAQLYMCFNIIQERQGKSVFKTFGLWSTLLMAAHLLGVLTTMFFDFTSATFVTEYIIRYCISDLLIILVTFVFVFIFSVKTKTKEKPMNDTERVPKNWTGV